MTNVGKFANLVMWSDVEPFEIVKETAKTITIRAMKAEKDPSFKPDISIGGFAGHCNNNRKQEWIITPDETAPQIKAYLRKDGHYHSKLGRHKITDTPIKFYDHNF